MDAIRITVNAIGRINPFIAPARISSVTGFPMKIKISVAAIIKSEIIYCWFLSIAGCNVLKNDTEVKDAPTTDVIAAHHITNPKNLNPTLPAAKWNTEPAGLF